MVQRRLRIRKDGSLELDGENVNLEEYEDTLKQDQKQGDDTPIQVLVPLYTDEASPVGVVFTRLLELADQYRHPVDMLMGQSE